VPEEISEQLVGLSDLSQKYHPEYKDRSEFSDIEIAFLEFKKDSVPLLSLDNGTYQIEKNPQGYTFKSYSLTDSLWYIVYTECMN
jgi:hypothetical protein